MAPRSSVLGICTFDLCINYCHPLTSFRTSRFFSVGLHLEETNNKPKMASTSQKKSVHSLMAANLSKLTIPPPSSSSSTAHHDFEFCPSSSHDTNASPSPALPGSPPVIQSRSHSFVGPSPLFAQSSNSLFHLEELDSQSEDEAETDVGKGLGSKVAVDEKQVGVSESGEKVARKIGPGDFQILRVVGQGAFGKVFLVRKKSDRFHGEGGGDGIYAMKVMRKETIIKKNHVDYMKGERDILTKVVHPFIVQLQYSFQSKSKLYLILDFINGGHLFYHLYRQGIFSEDQARIYTAEIVSAVSHLHKTGIVHRDLKPENILMDADGHVMLTDFGMAKEIDESGRSNSLCGTTEYMAPEIIMAKGHNKEADWWSVGIVLYEMLTGKPPYTHNNRKKLQEKIVKEQMKLPPFLTSEAHSLLKGLLQKDPSKRLGNGPNGDDQIKSHNWFRSINWTKLEARELQPKFKPDVTGRECTANFDQCWTSMPPDDSPAPTPTESDHFQGYTYVAPNPWLSSG